MIAYKFGPFLLLRDTAILKKGGKEILLTKRRYEIISLLVERADQIVTREEILATIWAGQIVGEGNLAQQIYTIRRLLGDDSRNQSYIETVPGIGYRFKAPVEKVEVDIAATDTARGDEVGADPAPASAQHRQRPLDQWRGRIVVAVILIMAIGSGAFFYLVRRGQASDSSGVPVIEPVITLPGNESYPKFSRNGRYLAFTWEGDSRTEDIYYLDLERQGELHATRLTDDPGVEHQAVWSPDHREIAFLRIPKIPGERYHLVVKSIEGGPEREVGRAWGGLDWSPDGRYFAISDSEGPNQPTGIYLLPSTGLPGNGSGRRPLSRPGKEENVFDTFPRYSPDGRFVAFVRWWSDFQSDIFLVEVAGSRISRLTFDQSSISDLDWSTDGQRILFTSVRKGNQRLWQIGAGGGTPELVPGAPYDIKNFTISPENGGLAFTNLIEDSSISLHELPASGPGRRRCSINSSRTEMDPQFSPDGRMLTFASTRSGMAEIWIAAADCTNPRRLTTLNEVGIGSAKWSPDGKMLAFNRFSNGNGEIYTINREGADLRPLTRHAANDFTPTWSHDGRWIYFTSDRYHRFEIWKIPAEGGQEIQVTDGGGRVPFATPDGRYLYYTRQERLRRIELATMVDRPVEALRDIKVERYWHPTSRYIYFAKLNPMQKHSIHRLHLDTGRIEMVLEIDRFLPMQVPGLTVSPDEKRLAISWINYSSSDIMLMSSLR
jgi:Tol biopolymer transport system component/DNA-binding winged helix-turn-helix (wHTH) protein